MVTSFSEIPLRFSPATVTDSPTRFASLVGTTLKGRGVIVACATGEINRKEKEMRVAVLGITAKEQATMKLVERANEGRAK